jgi:hypothetical protein
MDLTPFKTLPLIKYFQHDLEKIKMAYRLSDSIRTDLSNIRAAGDQVELAVKDFFHSKLFPRYHVCDGHIVDSSLKASPQFDIIVAENSRNPVLFDLADKSQLIYFEPVFAFAEVKRSFYSDDLLKNFSINLERMANELRREEIPRNFIESGGSGFQVEGPLTDLPLRNPSFAFMFFVESSQITTSKIRKTINKRNNAFLPNFIVLLDQGIIVNVDDDWLSTSGPRINLYPQYQANPGKWVLLDLGGEDNVLIFQYMLLLEHLNVSISSAPDLLAYSTNLFDLSMHNFHEL